MLIWLAVYTIDTIKSDVTNKIIKKLIGLGKKKKKKKHISIEWMNNYMGEKENTSINSSILNNVNKIK